MSVRKVHPDYVCMVLLIALLLVKIHGFRESFEYLNTFTRTINIIMILVCVSGIIILAMPDHKGPHRALIVGSAVYGVMCLAEARNLLSQSFQYDISAAAVFIESIVVLLISLVLLFNVALYVRRLSNSTALIRYALIVSIIVEAIGLIDTYRLYDDMEFLWMIYRDSIPEYLLCIYLIILVNSKEIKSKTVIHSIRVSFRKMESACFFQGLTVERSVVERIMDLDGSDLWCDRYVFAMNSFEPGDYKAVMERDGDRTHVIITSKDDASGLNGYRFNLAGVMLDTGDIYTCDTVRLYGEDGFFVQLIVSEEYIDRSRKRSVRDYLDKHPKLKRTKKADEAAEVPSCETE